MFSAKNKLYKAIRTHDQILWIDRVAKNILGRVIYAPLSGSASNGAYYKSLNWEHLRKESRNGEVQAVVDM